MLVHRRCQATRVFHTLGAAARGRTCDTVSVEDTLDTVQGSPATDNQPLVVLGVSGCIAAYKACELVRVLQRRGCRVKVVMTENATRFVGVATFKALTREPVAVSLFDTSAAIHHISLAEEADVFVVAPATALLPDSAAATPSISPLPKFSRLGELRRASE